MCSFLTIRPALPVGSVIQGMAHHGIDHHHHHIMVRKRHQLAFEGRAVDHQKTAAPRKSNRKLIHDAARRPGIFVLRPLAKQRFFDRIKHPS